MSRDSRSYVADILEAIRQIDSYVEGMSFPEFAKDRKTFDAVVRNLEIIGEAAKKVPEDLRREDASVDWRGMAGFRDVLIHGYFRVEPAIVWEVVREKLPTLARALTKLL